VGKPVDGIEFKLASDGEILFRGRNVFKSYFKDSTATAQVFDADGWAHTGDLAEFDSRGLIKIKGRKKEILKTSGGKMVAPLPIEEALKASPIISQVCMVGDGRKFLSALITLSEAKRAELQKSGAVVDGPMITSTEVVGEVNRYIQSVNEGLASYEQIKKFAVLAHEFTIDAGEMTPTLKMKRNVIESRYQSVINRFYD
jgi:long-chain acyl-CoA synthetase